VRPAAQRKGHFFDARLIYIMFLNMDMISTMLQRARTSLFVALLTLSLLACAVLFSTFLSTTSASNGHSSFSHFAPRNGEAALWRKISAFDRVAFIVVDALRSARVQVGDSFLPFLSKSIFSQLLINRIAQAPGKTFKSCRTLVAAFNLSVLHTPQQSLFRA
jgi:hypothetical protein